LDLVWPFKWPQKEFKGIFHDLLALHKEQIPLSTTSTTSFNVSFVHVFMIVTTIAQLIFATFFFGYFSRIGGMFTLFTIGWSKTLFCHLPIIVRSIISSPFLALISKELRDHILAQQVVGLCLS
jgi:predicted secreted protein